MTYLTIQKLYLHLCGILNALVIAFNYIFSRKIIFKLCLFYHITITLSYSYDSIHLECESVTHILFCFLVWNTISHRLDCVTISIIKWYGRNESRESYRILYFLKFSDFSFNNVSLKSTFYDKVTLDYLKVYKLKNFENLPPFICVVSLSRNKNTVVLRLK